MSLRVAGLPVGAEGGLFEEWFVCGHMSGTEVVVCHFV